MLHADVINLSDGDPADGRKEPRHLKNWLSQNAAGSICKKNPLGLDWLREESGLERKRERGVVWGVGWVIARKSWHVPSVGESAIHSLKHGLVSALVTLVIGSQNVRHAK